MGVNGGSLNRQGLTLKQARFVHYYIKTGGNGVVAAQTAGYQSNYQTLAAIASENLNKPKVRSELNRRMSKVLTSNEVLEKLSDVAESQVEKVTTADKLKALELVGKFHKLFTDRTETVDLTEHEGARTFIANEIASLSGDPIEREIELQRLFANKTAPNYDPKLDVNKNPLTWPSQKSLISAEIPADTQEIKGLQ